MPKIIFCFVKQAASLAQKHRAASPTAVVIDSAGNRFPGWRHLALHSLRVHMDATYEETVGWTSEMDRTRAVVQLARDDFPALLTVCRSFGQVPTRT